MNFFFEHQSFSILNYSQLLKFFMVSDKNLLSGISKKVVSGCPAGQGQKRGIKIYGVRQGSTD